MTRRSSAIRKRLATAALLTSGTVFQFGFLGTCEEKLYNVTDYVDPCGTIFGNCEPGDMQIQNSYPGDYCLDPACTVPGQCENEGPPLGTIMDLCP